MAVDRDGTYSHFDEWLGIVWTVLTASLFLWYIGIFTLLLLHNDQIVQYLKERTPIVVELDSLSSAQREQLERALEAMPQVQEHSIRYVSRQEGLDIMRQSLGGDWLDSTIDNPLRDIILFNVHAVYMHSDSMRAFIDQLRMLHGVHEVFVESGYVDEYHQWRGRIQWLFLSMGVLISLLAFGMIFNTLMWMLRTKRHPIRIMRLLGASREYFAVPFYRRALKYALVSALVGIGLILVTVFILIVSLPQLGPHVYWTRVLQTALFVTIISVVLYIGAMHIVLRMQTPRSIKL